MSIAEQTVLGEFDNEIPKSEYAKLYTTYFAMTKKAKNRFLSAVFLAPVVKFPHFVKASNFWFRPELGPDKEQLERIKEGQISFERYAELYRKKLQSLFEERGGYYLTHLTRYVKELRMPVLIFCYEKDPTECHRSILYDFLLERLAEHLDEDPRLLDGGEVVYA